jgi:thiamine biosynthesis lipoprotein
MRREELSFPAMGTEAHLVALEAPPHLLHQARERLGDLERRWSRFLPDSELTQLNRSAGRPVVVSAETFRLVEAAIEAWRWSHGRFDPTVATTMIAAGYDRPLGPPGPGRVRSTGDHLPCPSPVGVVLDPYPGSITLPPGVAFDLGGIAKGAAADLVAAELLAGGAAGCCVNLGGDLRVAGHPPRPPGWVIELACDGADIATAPTVGVVDGAVCTSTRIRRSWTGPHGDEHHLRDPTTGAPLDRGLATVVVIAARAQQAEVLTKTAFAAGPLAAPDLLAGVGATGLLVTNDGATHHLAGLDPFLQAGGRHRLDGAVPPDLRPSPA